MIFFGKADFLICLEYIYNCFGPIIFIVIVVL